VTDIHVGMVDDGIHHVAIVGVWHTHGYGICPGIHMTSGIHVARVGVWHTRDNGRRWHIHGNSWCLTQRLVSGILVVVVGVRYTGCNSWCVAHMWQ
jgi:hypothetical protein